MNGRWFARVAASAAIRRVVYLLIALAIGYVGIGEAHAAEPTSCVSANYLGDPSCTRQKAHNNASLAIDALANCPSGWPEAWREVYEVPPNAYRGRKNCYSTSEGRDSIRSTSNIYYWNTANGGCPTGQVWNDAEKVCETPYEGPTDEECMAINAQPGFAGVGPTSRPLKSMCMANGCMFETTGPSVTTTDPNNGAVTHGQFEWTGACAEEPIPGAPTAEEQANIPAESCTTEGQGDLRLCVKRNGEHCYDMPGGSGKRACWTPGGVGEKTSGEVLQKRSPGTVPDAPSRSDVTQVGPTKTTTTTKDPLGTTIITTVVNYTTNDGTDAGPDDDGEPADGSGDDDEEQEGSVIDDGTCDTQPEVSGGDPLLANIILQTWGARCAAADDNAITTNGVAIDDCSQAWSITDGTDANVAKLKALRKSICPDATDEAAGIGSGDYGVDGVTGGEGGEGAALAEFYGEDVTVGADGLDTAGFGFTRGCPDMPIVEVMGVTVDFNLPAMCDWMQLGGQLVLILAALASLRILAGGFS